MARALRIEYEGAVHHIISRGNARHAIFVDDADRAQFLQALAYTIEWSSCTRPSTISVIVKRVEEKERESQE